MSTLAEMSLNSRSQYSKHSEISIYVFGFALCSVESCFFRVRLSPAFLAPEWGLTTPHRTDRDLTKSEENDRTGITCQPRSSSFELISSNNKGTPPLLFGSRRMISIDQDSSSNNSGDIEWMSIRKRDTRSPMILKSDHWPRGLLCDLGLWSILQIFVRIGLGRVRHTDASAKSCAGGERISVTNQDTSSPNKTKIQSLPPRFIVEVGASEQPDRFSFQSPRLHRIINLSSFEATRKRALVNGSQHPLYHFHRFSFLDTVF